MKDKDVPFTEKTFSFISNILFTIVFVSLFVQMFLWIIDFIFKTNLLNYKIPIANVHIYYLAILLGVKWGIGMSKKSSIKSK